MFGLGFPELAIILVIALLVFGAGKLPSVMGSLGKGMREFKKSVSDPITDGTSRTTEVEKPVSQEGKQADPPAEAGGQK